jgi:transposase InsO family protein
LTVYAECAGASVGPSAVLEISIKDRNIENNDAIRQSVLCDVLHYIHLHVLLWTKVGTFVKCELTRKPDGQRDLPTTIDVDQGSQFTSKELDLWAYANGITLDLSRPGKPTDNAYVESFNATVRLSPD